MHGGKKVDTGITKGRKTVRESQTVGFQRVGSEQKKEGLHLRGKGGLKNLSPQKRPRKGI